MVEQSSTAEATPSVAGKRKSPPVAPRVAKTPPPPRMGYSPYHHLAPPPYRFETPPAKKKLKNLMGYSLEQASTLQPQYQEVHEIDSGRTLLVEKEWSPETRMMKGVHRDRAKSLSDNPAIAEIVLEGFMHCHPDISTPELAQRFDEYQRNCAGDD